MTTHSAATFQCFEWCSLVPRCRNENLPCGPCCAYQRYCKYSGHKYEYKYL